MLLRFPLPMETTEDDQVETNLYITSTPKNEKQAECRSFCTYKGVANLLTVVTIACVLILSTSGADAYRDVRGFGLSAQNAISQFERNVLSSGLQTPQGTSMNKEYDFRHFLGIHHDRRKLATTPSSTTRLLAVKDNRPDPLNHLRKYRGGYDVKNKHYWASTIFTGIYGYAIGAAWLLLGLLLVLLACCRLCCCRRQRSNQPHSSTYYWLPRLLTLLLSLFAIGLLITLFIRNKQLHNEALNVRNTIVTSANNATGTVRNVSATLSNVDAVIAKYNIAGLGSINSTITNLNQQADNITSQVNTNIRTLNRLINDVEIALIVVLAVGLFLVVAGLVAALLGWRSLLFIILALGWILTALTWVLFGLFFALNFVASDTCQAFTEYLQAPANTTLDQLLPCVDLATASSASTIARQGVSNIIIQANNTLTTIQQTSSRLGSTASIPALCDPIGPAPDYSYTQSCPAGTITIGQLPQTLQPHVCPTTSSSATCLSQGKFVTPQEFSTAQDFSNGGQSLLNIIPTINGLTNCSFVYNTFNTIVQQRCLPVRSALRNMWIPLLMLSIGLVFLNISWIISNRRNAQQRYSGTIHAQDYSPRGRTK